MTRDSPEIRSEPRDVVGAGDGVVDPRLAAPSEAIAPGEWIARRPETNPAELARWAHLRQAKAAVDADGLLPYLPRVERERLRPAAFPSIKSPTSAAVTLPGAELRAIRMMNVPEAVAAAARAEETVETMASPVALSQPRGEKGQDDPLWYSLFSPRGEEQVASGNGKPPKVMSFPPAAEDDGEELAGKQHKRRRRAKRATQEFDSPLPFRQAPKRPARAWGSIESVFLSRGFSQIVAAVIAVLFVSTLDVPWRQWFNRQMQTFKAPIVAAVNTLSRPVRERAAFFIVDDFSAGLEGWSDYPNLSIAANGLVKVNQGVALYDQTMELESYRLDIEARIESQAVGWAVRAQDADNLYAMKLEEVTRRAGKEFNLLRWSVTGGKWNSPTRVTLPAQLAHSGEFNRISVRVKDNQFTTLVNGWGVDFWRDEQFERGGVGLLASAGESALVRRMTISGNEDTWGLILYGTLETMRSVQDTLFPPNAPMALILRPTPLAFRTGPLSLGSLRGRQ